MKMRYRTEAITVALSVALIALLAVGCDDAKTTPADSAPAKTDGKARIDGATDDLALVDSVPSKDRIADDLAAVDAKAADASCVKPGAKEGPTCKVKSDCEAAKWNACFLECLPCGCLCNSGRCYDLRDWQCKKP